MDPIERLRATSDFILDLDGTVYLSETLLPGAKEFLEHRRAAGRRFVFITNNSSKTAEEYAVKLRRLGLPACEEDIYTSLDATLAWLGKQAGAGGESRRVKVYPVGTASLVEKVRAAGYEIAERGPDWVLLGFDTGITYEKITLAARAILGGAGFVATHPDITCPTADGPIPDVGSFIRMFEAATGRSPVICGKPFAPMVEGALGKLGGSVETACIIGDRLYTDMAMGRATGILAALVLSGETRREDIPRAPENHRPDIVFDNLSGVLAALKA